MRGFFSVFENAKRVRGAPPVVSRQFRRMVCGAFARVLSFRGFGRPFPIQRR
jgi:hypothetical protein